MRLTFNDIFSLSSVALAILSMSCAIEKSESRPPQRILYEWHDDGGPGKVSACISLSDQIAEFERGGREIGWCYVATGKEGHATSPGNYTITEKVLDKYSDTYGWIEDDYGNVVNPDAKSSDRVPKGMHYVPAPMPNWMRITSYGVGMHGGVIPEPGEPASHGCIRLPKDFAPILYDSVAVGTPVTITREHRKSLPLQQSEQSKTPPNTY